MRISDWSSDVCSSDLWHALTTEVVLQRLDADVSGLSHSEAAARLTAHGPNALPTSTVAHPVLRFLAQFNNALIYFLLAAAFAAAMLGHMVDALVIAAVVLVNAIVGFVQEGKAERALGARSEERRAGKERFSTCSLRWSAFN